MKSTKKATAASTRSTQIKPAGAPQKILFIGNSFTQRNDLPALLTELARAAGFKLQTRLISVGGAPLRGHLNRGDAQRSIQSDRYDYVVLQEQSTLPFKNAARMHENVRLFDEVIRKSGAKTALYLTWARRHSPEKQQAITDAYTSIGNELKAKVVPVGVAWQKFLAEHDQPVLHDEDESHPTLAGSFLAACVFFATLFGKSPAGLKVEVPGLSAGEVDALQRAASEKLK